MALTPEEIALIQEMKARGASLEDVKAELAKGRVISTKQGVTAPPIGRYTGTTAPVTETLSDVGETLKGMIGGAWETGQRITEDWQAREEQGFARTATNIANEFVGGVANVAIAQPFMGALKVIAPESVEKDVANKFMSVAAPIVGSDKVQGWMQGYQWLEQNDPTEFRRVRAELSALQGALDLLGLESVKGASVPVREGISQVTTSGIKAGKEGIQQLLGKAPEVSRPTGAGAILQETAENIPRAFEHLAQKAADARMRVTARREAATPQIEQALKVNVPQRQITLLTSLDDQTAKMVDEAMYAYEGGNRTAVSDMYSNVGTALYQPIENRLNEIGRQIGVAIDNLPNASVDMRPAQQNLLAVLRENGVDVTIYPSGRVAYNYTPESAIIESQRKIVEEALNKVFGTPKLTSRGIYKTDQAIGTLNRQLWNSDIIAPRITVNGQDQLLMTAVRDIFRSPLDDLSPEMRALNREYAMYRGFIEDLDNTLFNTGRELNIKVDPGDAIQNRIRRIFSNAQSAKQYERVYEKLYDLAVQNGYNGPDLKNFAEIDEYLKRLYPESAIAPTSLPGSIRTSLGDVLERFINVGTPNARDQQNAIRALLQRTSTSPDVLPSGTALPEVTAPQPTKGSQSVSSPNSTTLTPEQESKIVRSLTKERGAAGPPSDEWLVTQAKRELVTATGARKAELEAFIASKEKPASAGTQFGGATIFETYPATYTKTNVGVTPSGKTRLSPLHNKGFKLDNFENAQGFANKPKILEDEAGNTFAYLKKPFDKLGKQDKYALSPFGYKDKKIYLTEDGGKTWFEAQPTEKSLMDKIKGAVKQFGEDMKNEDGFAYNPFFKREVEIMSLPKFMEDTMGMEASPKAFYNAAKKYEEYVRGFYKEGQATKKQMDVATRNLKWWEKRYKQGGSVATGVKKGTRDPFMQTKKEVPMKDVSGQKFTIPEGELVTAYVDGKKVTLQFGTQEKVVPMNQYDNLKGQSIREVATPFAPELEGTERVVRGKPINKYRTRAEIDDYANKLQEKYDIPPERALATYKNFVSKEEAKKLEEMMDDFFQDTTEPTKYEQYTLPGGENYTEIIRTAPVGNKRDFSQFKVEEMDYGDGEVRYFAVHPNGRSQAFKTRVEAQKALEKNKETYGEIQDDANTYTSSHFPDTPNPIYHLRLNDRTWNKNKVTFMEELQSDWAREAKSKNPKYVVEEATNLPDGPNGPQWWASKVGDENDAGKLFDTKAEAEAWVTENNVIPNHPLLKDWQIPAVKDALMEAVDRKSKIFAWINGDQTSARYNLATYVDDVKWGGKGNMDVVEELGATKTIQLAPKGESRSFEFGIDDGGVIRAVEDGTPNDWKGKKLDEVLGKGLADEIMKADKGNLSGEGLKFGGEWANNLYDKQVRDIVKKLTGAEVKKADMGLGSNNDTIYRTVSGDALTQKDLKVGNEIGSFYRNEDTPEIYVIGEVLGDGKIKAVSKNDWDKWNDKTFPEFRKRYPTFDDLSPETIDITTGGQLQQYIELTPEVVAKIQGKAPNLKLNRDITTYGIPLALLYFSQNSNQ